MLTAITGRLKTYWIIGSSALIGILYLLLTMSKQKARDAKLESERQKIKTALATEKQKAATAKEGADNAKKKYAKLLDNHPDLREYLDQ